MLTIYKILVGGLLARNNLNVKFFKRLDMPHQGMSYLNANLRNFCYFDFNGKKFLNFHNFFNFNVHQVINTTFCNLKVDFVTKIDCHSLTQLIYIIQKNIQKIVKFPGR